MDGHLVTGTERELFDRSICPLMCLKRMIGGRFGGIVDQSGAAKIAWSQVAVFAEDISTRLELFKIGAASDCGRLLGAVRPHLEALANRGGDPRFALGVLAGARWRRLRPPGAQFPQWIRLLERLSGQDELYRLIGKPEEARGQLLASVTDALMFLRSFGWQDEGIFEGRGTSWQRKTRRGAPRHADRAVAVLNWHLRTGTTGRWDRLSLLAKLLQGFEVVKAAAGEDVPVETVKKRAQRLDGEYFAKFSIPIERLGFHQWHTHLGNELGRADVLGCGTACSYHEDGLSENDQKKTRKA